MATIPFEAWLFLYAITLICIGIIGTIIRTQIKHKCIQIAQVIGLFGILFLVISYLYSAIWGRFLGFIQVTFTSPISFLQTTLNGLDYTGACVDPKNEKTCMKYCCTNVSNSKDKWKDCSEFCDSRKSQGIYGFQDEGDCRYYQNYEGYCNLAKYGRINNNNQGGCNYIENYGPITCSCCLGEAPLMNLDNQQKWWDCSTECNSRLAPDRGGIKGHKLPKSVCDGIQIYACDDTR